jgi:hypothetical protein
MAIVLGTIAIVIVTVALGMLIDRKIGFLPAPKDFETDAERARKKLPSHVAGEAPATALRVGDAQIAKIRASQRCMNCRASMTGEPDDIVRYNDTDLLVLHFGCPGCASKRALYLVRLSG